MNPPDCIFCKIVRQEIPANEVLRDEQVVAFHDLNPQAPSHVLIVPALHADHLSEFVAKAPAAMQQRLFAAAAEIGKKLERDGYRVVINEGPDGGQTVRHLHLHVLAGRRMTWPPG